MYYLVLLFAAAALLSGGRTANVNRHMKLLAEMDNHIQTNAVPTSDSSSKKFISLTSKLPAFSIHKPGTTLELTCEALAAPAPSIHWFRNDAPVYEFDLESNEIIDTNPTSLARITSTLLVPRSEGTTRYSCLVVAGSLTTKTTTVVVSADGTTDLTERSKLVPLAPRVLVSYKVFVDVIGNKVVLPCRVRGHPRPHVVWTYDNSTIAKNPRMKVLRSGELVISSLRWSDMGEFTCRATNMFGAAHTTTFVYPARPNDTDG
ncbi:neural/ectodermal development factor IMP-L2-like [Epargyreus clarus]|uniref:neural/ectodermal development factor IMP-L2-like n=1 Tax=Epargyreus clarus TaxID=520877 RepID=UPI003C2FF2CA